MRDKLLILCAVLLAAGCGVNPDRLATMHEKNAKMAENKTAEADGEQEGPILEFDDNDPAPVRQAIMDLQDLEKLVKEKRYQEYLEKRYDLMRMASYEASPDLATSAKTPLIIDAVYELDKRVATVAGGSAQQNFETVGRVDIASADALYALNDAFEACRAAVAAKTETGRSEGWTKYQSSVERARAVDAKALTYVGKRMTGTGYLDVPVELVVCEARMSVAKAEAEDAPAAEPSLAKTYQGCGFYPIDLEAKQTGPNKFGEYLITSAYVADVDPGPATAIDCGAIPPVSDAEAAVQKTVEEFVAWLQPTDVVSMAGSFQYTGPEGQKLKKGTVRVYRREATLKTNACGVDDPKLTCEAEGSTLAKAYNHAQHYLQRADFHRQQGNVDRCKKMADFAFKAAAITSPEGADKKFLVAGKQQMSRPEITGKLDELKKQAQERMSSDWCAGQEQQQ